MVILGVEAGMLYNQLNCSKHYITKNYQGCKYQYKIMLNADAENYIKTFAKLNTIINSVKN